MENPPDLMGRSLTSLANVSREEFLLLLDVAVALKARRKRGLRGWLLAGKHVALVFEKGSTRTRCAATVAVTDEGGAAEYLGSSDIHLGKKESVADTARVLGRMFDGIMFRGYLQETVDVLAKFAGVPVWNGLTDTEHPTQALADLMTLREAFGGFAGLKAVYVGDGRNNVANSLMAGCALVGVDFVNCSPAALAPDPAQLEQARRAAAARGTAVEWVEDPKAAVRGANMVYTDVWTSMGEEDRFEERARLLRPYQVNGELMRATGNLDAGRAIFLHCLPALHDNRTDLTRELGALEVTDEVFEAPYSRVFDQAENRMHTIKALMVATMAGVREVLP